MKDTPHSTRPPDLPAQPLIKSVFDRQEVIVVYSDRKITESEIDRLEERLSRKFGKKVIVLDALISRAEVLKVGV